jgi:epoxyqueuosine reductase
MEEKGKEKRPEDRSDEWLQDRVQRQGEQRRDDEAEDSWIETIVAGQRSPPAARIPLLTSKRMAARSDRVEAARIFREEAGRQGFSRVGIARAEEPPRFDRFRDWIGAGRHAAMAYLERTLAVRASPEELLAGARSIVCLAAPHRSEPLTAADGSTIARYAAGSDYHGTLRERATRVARAAEQRIGGNVRWRVCVDSTPLAERSFAAAAGLGWIGKNGCLIDRELGSYVLLAEIVTDADLPADEPVAELCGSCVRCLESCPTDAFVSPGLLDANHCLAYWTIEHRGPIPDDVKEKVAEHVFGCDVCQEVCPWNEPIRPRLGQFPHPSPLSREWERGGSTALPSRAEWIAMGPGEWRRRFGATALNRAGRRGIQRNAAVSAGATMDRSALPSLERPARTQDRGLADAARWAKDRLNARIERTT